MYQASQNYAANLGWTGSVSSGLAGTTSAAFKEDVRRRINYYRTLAGLPGDIVFSEFKSAKCQKAALMMSANRTLNHYPPSSWIFYSADGREAAGASNLAMGSYGPAATDGYMADPGSGNQIVGHRRWLLYPQAREMATGDIPASGTFSATNSLWVIGDFKATPPAKFVAWPNEGYAPAPLVPARWSLSYPGADFSTAVVSMSRNGSNVALTVVSRTDNGYGDNTIVWEPSGMPTSITADVPCVVTVSGIKGNGVPTSKSYTVVIFNPDILGEEITIAGSDNPSAGGELYGFNPIAQADSYQVQVSSVVQQNWTEGAEDWPAPRITAAVSAGYNLRQTALVRSGAKAFQLAFPFGVWADQSFMTDREIIPQATSRLNYSDRARFTYYTNTLETQISADGGNTWTTLASRTGVNYSGSAAEWDSAWNNRSISLAAYAGKVVKLRFILKSGGGNYPGTDANYGFFIDDITITNSSEVTNAVTTTLGVDATSFTLDGTTAGTPLVAGAVWFLRVRPNVGCRWFAYGPGKTVTVTPAPVPAFTNWAAGFEVAHGLAAGTLADPNGDHDHDGRPNLLEYAFGGSPLSANDPASRLPAPQASATHFVLSYQIDTSLGDLVITPQACPVMGNWKAPGEPGAPSGFTDELIATDGNLQTRAARLPLDTAGTCFLRIRVSRR